MSIGIVSSVLQNTGNAAAAPEKPKDLHTAAQQFEALLIDEMLRSMHGADAGWLGTGDDQAGSLATDMAESQLSQAMAAAGGLGLAKTIENVLGRPTAAPLSKA